MKLKQDLRHLAISLVAIPIRLPQALWAILVDEFDLQQVAEVPSVLTTRGILECHAAFERTWVDAQVRAQFEAQLADRDPSTWKKAHHICARFFSRRQCDADVYTAVEHWLRIGDRPRVFRLLEKLSEGDFDAHISPSVTRAVMLAVEGAEFVPAWLRAMHARLLEKSGALNEALDVYDGLIATAAKQKSLRIAAAQWAAAAGQVALRAGHIRRAKLLYDMGVDLAETKPRPDLEALAARLALARGDLVRAQRLFRKAEKLAERAGDREQRAEARSGLGVVAMRAGKPCEAVACYRRALPACAGATSRTARVMANLATALTLTGGHSEAIELFEEAIRMRDRMGEILGVANSLAALAAAREAAGDKDGAVRDLAQARHLAARADDVGLVVEIHLLQSGLALRCGAFSLARAEWQRALTSYRTMEHVDPLVAAMLEEVSAELQLSRRRFLQAFGHARAALRILRKNGAHYFATRIRILLARLTFAANRPKMALRHLDLVARAALAYKYVFPSTTIDRRLLELGSRSFDETTIHFCKRLLGDKTSHRLSKNIIRESTGVRLIDRQGARLVDEREVALLRQTPPHLLLDGPKQRLVVRGRVMTLGGKRLMVPLLLLFLEHPTQSFDASEIHRDVWGQDNFDDSAALRVRVALSRLRALVGSDVLVTSRVTGATGVTSTLYRLCPQIDYAAIEHTLGDE